MDAGFHLTGYRTNPHLGSSHSRGIGLLTRSSETFMPSTYSDILSGGSTFRLRGSVGAGIEPSVVSAMDDMLREPVVGSRQSTRVRSRREAGGGGAK